MPIGCPPGTSSTDGALSKLRPSQRPLCSLEPELHKVCSALLSYCPTASIHYSVLMLSLASRKTGKVRTASSTGPEHHTPQSECAKRQPPGQDAQSASGEASNTALELPESWALSRESITLRNRHHHLQLAKRIYYKDKCKHVMQLPIFSVLPRI